MNKFGTFVLLVLVGLVGLGTYWYVKPHHAPSFLSGIMPAGIAVPKPASPMSNFRPPQF